MYLYSEKHGISSSQNQFYLFYKELQLRGVVPTRHDHIPTVVEQIEIV